MRVGLGREARAAGPDGAPVLLGVAVAIADALLGAAGLGSAAERNPPGTGPGSGGTSPSPAEGAAFLEEAVRAVEAENYQVVNVDVLVTGIGDEGGSLGTVAARVAEILHAPPAAVSLKPVSGRRRPGESGSVTARAVVLIDQIGDLDALHATIRTGG